MTYSSKIKQALKQGRILTYRMIETEIQSNHPRKSLKQAIEELRQEGCTVKEGQEMNVNTNKGFKTWKLK
jgi:tRNA(Ser,Leu) C12 N-acetylase TAN1